MYSKESLEALRERVDLVEVISSYVPLKKQGASYKGLCPFHDEKTPSFTLNKSDSHYHCFGCGAHGDAIAFLMEHVKMSFVEALEYLSERFHVPLEKVQEEEKGPNKKRLRLALDKAARFYRFFLLHSQEGKEALTYLFGRDIDLGFIERFELGYAPAHGSMVYQLLRAEGFSEEELQLAGLVRVQASGRRRDFFSHRILFPIRDRMGAVIGFSGRKFKEETFGGKYINTPETPLFKKSQTLFGFSYSRSRMARDQVALVVEGQLDALRLIYEGFDYAIAGQGTAFGEDHAKETLRLGVKKVYLAFDGDRAGKEASIKVGDIFQGKGVEVLIVNMGEGSDPDTFLREEGAEAFEALTNNAEDYLSFYYRFLTEGQDVSSPAKKNEIVETIAASVRAWQQPVLVHESLKRLSELADVPREALGSAGSAAPRVSLRRSSALSPSYVDADRVLEMDLLRWLFLFPDPESFPIEVIGKNITTEDFKVPACASLFETYLALPAQERKQWLTLASHLKKKEEQDILNELLRKKVNKQKVEESVVASIQGLLQRNWMLQKQSILDKIKQRGHLEDEVAALLQEFNDLNRSPPTVIE